MTRGAHRRTVVAMGTAAALVWAAQLSPAAAAPVPQVRFTDVAAGPTRSGPAKLGTPITIYGRGFGRTRGRSQVTIGGVPVARYLRWGGRSPDGRRETIVVQPGQRVRGGRVVVTVDGRSSSSTVSFTGLASARLFTVAVTGVDGRPCTLALPCATVAFVMRNRMRPGDVVLMRAGRYVEDELWIRGDYGDSGTAGRPRTIAAWPGARVDLVSPGRPWIVDADYITLAGLRFHSGKAAVIPDSGATRHRGDRFVGNVFRGTIGYAALALHGDDLLVAGNDCRLQGSTVGTEGHCFYISDGRRIRVRDNTASGAPGYGIHVFDQLRASDDRRRVISDVVIEGNLLTASRERSGLILAMGDEGARGNRIDTVLIRANTFRGNNHAGIVVGANVHNVTIRGNMARQNGRQAIIVVDDPTIRAVRIEGNTLVQSANRVCRMWCSWYPVAHISVGSRARPQVSVHGNGYGPGAPRVIGAQDRAAHRISG